MAKGKSKISSKSQKGHYQMYKDSNRCVRNRTKRLKCYVAKNPNDFQAKKALDRGLQYRRKKPISWKKVWSPVAIELAHSLRLGGTNGNLALEYLAQDYAIFR